MCSITAAASCGSETGLQRAAKSCSRWKTHANAPRRYFSLRVRSSPTYPSYIFHRGVLVSAFCPVNYSCLTSISFAWWSISLANQTVSVWYHPTQRRLFARKHIRRSSCTPKRCFEIFQQDGLSKSEERPVVLEEPRNFLRFQMHPSTETQSKFRPAEVGFLWISRRFWHTLWW